MLATNATIDMMNPGAQKAHWKPVSSSTACCSTLIDASSDAVLELKVSCAVVVARAASSSP